ncbi:MAG: quinohemoprotein amine dehydrogenase subunit beta [Rhodospirillales bacterium]|nr:quinohemoprotein amine dehydrogenase subunit beta [Rhodospirillales bacterium]
MKRSIIGLMAATLAVAGATSADAKDYILTGTKGNKLFLVDPGARKVERVYDVPGSGGIVQTVPSPDGKIAYLMTNQWGGVVGLDLESGKPVFSTDFSTSRQVRTKSVLSMDISPDGKELFVHQTSVKLGLGEYEVLPTQIAVYDTASGMDAKPVRTFPAPRRVNMLAMSKDGQTLYAMSWDFYMIDPKTGKIKGEHKIQGWDRANASPPDILDFWPLFEQTNVFSTPYFYARTDKDPMADPEAFKTGILTLDLKTGEYVMDDFENTSAIIFSSVVSPNRKEAFGVYTQLSKIDLEKDELVKRIELPHTYYAVNISSDGKEVYVGGTMCDIGVHSAETLDRLATIELPGCYDMGAGGLRMIQR